MSEDAATALAEFRGTPEQATKALADMTAAYRGAPPPDVPADAAGAAARLELLASNADWGARLLSNDVAAKAEFARLTELVSKMSPADLALAGVLPEASIDFSGATPAAPLRDQVAAVPILRQMGIGDDAIRQVLADQPVSKEEHAFAQRWLDAHMADREWSGKLLAGNHDARRELTLCNIILASGVK